jgi:aminoglycoside phosphotransferase (APT) family kinase protein
MTDVIDTPDRLRFDEGALDAYLRRHVAGYDGPLEVRKFAGGESNPTYLLHTPGRDYVLRRKPPGELLPSAHAVDREHRVMSVLGPTGFPVPETYALCEDPSVIGTAFFVMERAEGRIVWDKTFGEVPRESRREMFFEAARVLARLHAVDPGEVGLGDFGKTTDYFARQIGRWTKQYDAAETERIPEMERLKAWLPGAIPASDKSGGETAIVHGDYKIDNLVLSEDCRQVRAVLDWELSTLGHPLADLSYFLMIWGLPKASGFGIADIDFEGMDIPRMEEVMEAYGEASGRAGLPDLPFCMAYNMFRMAGIVQGVYKRALDGNASSEKAKGYGAMVPVLAESGWEWARRAGA